MPENNLGQEAQATNVPFTEATTFSAIRPVHTVRRMRQLTVYEEEIDDVALLNNLASWFFSAASGCFLFSVGLVITWLMQGTLSEKGTGLLQFGAPAGAIFAIGFAIAGVWAARTKASRIRDIKAEAVEIPQTPQRLMPVQASTPPSTSGMVDSQPQ